LHESSSPDDGDDRVRGLPGQLDFNLRRIGMNEPDAAVRVNAGQTRAIGAALNTS